MKKFIISILKWIKSFFRKSVKASSGSWSTDYGYSSGWDTKYSGIRRYTKAPAIQ